MSDLRADVGVNASIEAPSTSMSTKETAETKHTEMVTGSVPVTVNGDASDDEESFTEVKISDVHEEDEEKEQEIEAPQPKLTPIADTPVILEPTEETEEKRHEHLEKDSPVESTPVPASLIEESTEKVEEAESPPDAPEKNSPIEAKPAALQSLEEASDSSSEKSPSPTIYVPDMRDRELPPLPNPPLTPKAGIPLPISTDRPVQSEARTAPPTPMRESSKNAPTTSSARVTSASLTTNNSAGQPSLSSMVFVVQALESIGASKEGKRRKPLGESVQRALTAIRDAAPQLPPDPAVVFAPLQIACTVQNTAVVTTALDCIGKLISYSYFSILPPAPPGEPERADEKIPAPETPLIEKAIETICDCFQGDTTPDMVQLQIIKALLAAVLNDKVIVHGAGLLKAVRQTYNIFLLSRNSPNQMTAQGTLTQMVHTVFERVKIRIAMKEANLAASANSGNDSLAALNRPSSVDGDSVVGGSEVPASAGEKVPEKITLQSFENRKSFDDERIADNAPTTVTRSSSHRNAQPSGSTSAEEDEDEIFTKDAFLVFRAMCKLSIKTLPAEQVADLKSHGMRSKLLSLHLLHTILKSHMIVFISPLSTIRSSSSAEATGFVHAIKQYLCLSLSRNAASAVGLVFEVCCEIFWLLVGSMRVMLKKEIEVFLKEIYLNILDNRHSSVQQKQYLLSVLERICSDPRALVEIYLNYDCDRTALDNMFQRLIEHLSRITTTQVSITELQQQQYGEERKKNENNKHHGFSLPPSLSTANIAATPASTLDPTFPVEYTLKRQSLECLIAVLQSLVTWSQKGFVDVLQENAGRESQDGRDSLDNTYISPRLSTVGTPIIGTPYPELERSISLVDVNEMVDDPSQLEKAKQRKTALVEAIKKFNFKPKRGIKALVEGGFIESETPANIAEFLLKNNNSLDKKVIGEYLGEGEPENIAAMHAFVDQMDFVRMRFVDALRRFLQSFRLPGEAQKIDRFMLKFAERYISGNPNAFANADTAYVLAYSVILLNTDQHSAKLKGRARMTPDEFVKNNRGINDNADLPPEYLLAIYEEIRNNEIVLEGEKEREAARGAAIIESGGGIVEGIGRVLANAGRDLEREAYVHASEEMANKTEQLFKTLLKAQRRNGSRPQLSKYIAASSSKHVGPMFEVTWMSILSGLSGAAQDSNETEMIKLCMEGFKLAIRVACFFDLETPRIAFVTALAKFTHLNNLSEMKSKNVEALKALLDVAQTEGNLLKTSWRDVLTCISQLERFQLISSGVDEGSVPDVTKGRIIHPDAGSDARSRSSMQSQRPMRSRPRTQTNTHYVAEVAEESRSREVIIAVDKIFANTSKLTGEAIVDFVRALSEVSWQEIQSSGQSEHPRMFSLQKLVEISYYNMGRIRVEWSNLWNILGEHFNQVGCHTNTSVVFFALDSLRQLSMRFLEIEELPHFKFQKDFLKPFQHVMANNAVVPVKDMVLRCLSQMLQARGDKIKSGWRTMFGTFTYAAKENYDQIVNLAFDSVRKIYSTRFGVVVSQGGFTDMIVCLTEFAKNQRFQKISLQAIETLKGTVPDMLSCSECPLSQTKKPTALGDELNPAMIRTVKEDPMIKFWFPVLFSFHDILMTGEDLEARTRALGYLFDILVKYGGDFPTDFWDTICHELLFPIFMVLKSRSEMAHFSTQEAVGMWLSTTMIQALRNLIALFTHYFDLLERMLDGFLDLLVTCICQENDTIARIGSSCLQQLILQSVKKLRPEHWAKIVSAFVQLFEITTADQLFSAATQGSGARSVSGTSTHQSPPNEPKGAFNDAVMEEDADGENALKINGLSTPMLDDDSSDTSPEGRSAQNVDLEDYRPQQLTQQPVVTAARRRFFNKIITKCVLQLLMIETVSELFSNDAVYSEIPSTELLRLMGVLKKSFTFARRFNSDKELRMKLWREGFMKQPPNLLKQESGSASTYVSILLRMYHDDQRERRESRGAIESALIPLCVDILRSYTILDEETQQRNVIAWRPVVVDVMEGYTNFPERDFDRHIDTFYPLAVEMLNREPGLDVRIALQNLLRRVGEVKRMGIMGRGRVRDRRMSDMSGMNVRRTP